jgi:hypothetical protein
MHVSILRWDRRSGWPQLPDNCESTVRLVLVFGGTAEISDPAAPWRELQARCPAAVVAGCSTAGEICSDAVLSDGLVAAAVQFDSTEVRGAMVEVDDGAASHEAGQKLARLLATDRLRHVLVFSDGIRVNGTELTRGLRSALPSGAHVTGGLAGDGSRFERTCVLLGDRVATGAVVGIGFYGDDIAVTFGFAGGWEPFGPKRKVTRSEGNVLYTLDDQPALELYKRYLGDRAAGLPATGLLFPLQLMADRQANDGTVRTILAVDEAEQSLRFAGDVPQGQYVRLMKASADALIAGAEMAAASAHPNVSQRAELALLVSCVGRRLVMGQRVEEEIDAALARLPAKTPIIGFYSYGEISPGHASMDCDLHNQTMTVTVFAEIRRT